MELQEGLVDHQLAEAAGASKGLELEEAVSPSQLLKSVEEVAAAFRASSPGALDRLPCLTKTLTWLFWHTREEEPYLHMGAEWPCYLEPMAA